MEYKFCGGSIELLSETITNLLWYLWNLYCKEQEISLFWLIYNEGKLKVDIINTGYSHSFELETSYNGTIILLRTIVRLIWFFIKIYIYYHMLNPYKYIRKRVFLIFTRNNSFFISKSLCNLD